VEETANRRDLPEKGFLKDFIYNNNGDCVINPGVLKIVSLADTPVAGKIRFVFDTENKLP
jgi:hypothetical protein